MFDEYPGADDDRGNQGPLQDAHAVLAPANLAGEGKGGKAQQLVVQRLPAHVFVATLTGCA